jgi:mRNA interferase MazF
MEGVAPALLWVLMITSAAHRRWPGDVEVSDLAAAGLPAPSIVRCAKIATIETAAATPIGCLPKADRGAVAGHVSPSLSTMLKSLS